MKKEHIPSKFFAPKFWGAWIGIFFIRIFAFLPYSWMKKISVVFGRLFFNVAKTRRRIIEANINLSFPDKLFDGIFMYDTLQHIQNRDIALKECVRVLKSDGVIVVIEWNEKAVEEDYKKYGFKIDLVDPRDFLKISNISIEIIEGDLVRIFLISKN